VQAAMLHGLDLVLRIRGFLNGMRYINPRFTYLLTYYCGFANNIQSAEQEHRLFTRSTTKKKAQEK